MINKLCLFLCFSFGTGNLGGGVTQLVMGSALFPLFKYIARDSVDPPPAEIAWRTVSIVPAVVAFATGAAVFFISDDAPTGNYSDLKKHGSMPEVSAAASFRSGAFNFNTWLLFLQYAACFGVELTMNNAAALYFKDEFELSTESAAAIASIFGWMNLVRFEKFCIILCICCGNMCIKFSSPFLTMFNQNVYVGDY